MGSEQVVQYQDPKSIIVVNENGQMRHLFVPFRMVCIETVEQIPAGSIVFVDAVFLHRKYLLLYWINQRLLPYHYFTFQFTW